MNSASAALLPVTVYTFRDAEGQALYVGCTAHYRTRLGQHRRDKPWWDEVASVDRERHDTRAAGLAREAHLIQTLRPQHNIACYPPRYRGVLDAYLAGATMQAIGDERGITRERVRQLLEQEAPAWLLSLEAQRRRARIRLRQAAAQHRRMVESVRMCRVCGGPHVRVKRRTTCSGECGDLLTALRQHLPYCRIDRLKGRGRWLTVGSASWDAALACYERRLPIFDELPEDIQLQVRGEPRSWESPTGPERACEECDERTTNPRFCSLACYYGSGRIGQAPVPVPDEAVGA